jgi:hypothetical protein
MRRILASLGGVVMLAGLGAAPLVPSEMDFKFAYSRPCVMPVEYVQTATGSVRYEPPFQAQCTSGDVYVAAFADRKGNVQHIEITPEQYKKMGEKDGGHFNPTKQEFISAYEAMAPQVEAAIAFDSATGDQSISGTSLTFAHTTSGANRLLFVGVGYQNTSADQISGVTYNSVAMTQVGVRKHATQNDRAYLFALQAPATGANNVVITRTVTGAFEAYAASFTGAQQSVTMDSTANNDSAASTITQTTTVIASSSFLVSAHYTNRGQTAGANTTVIGTLGNFHGEYSTAAVGTGSQSLVTTQSDGTRTTWFLASFAEAATAATPNWQPIIWFD